MASAICLLVAICLTFATGYVTDLLFDLNNQKAPTERRQFLEQNGTQDCDISLDPKIRLDCCEFIKGWEREKNREWDGDPRPGIPCDWLLECPKNLKMFKLDLT